MIHQEIKNSPHTLNSQGDQSPPKLHTLVSTSSSNSNTFKTIFSPQIFGLNNNIDSQKPLTDISPFQLDSDQNNSQINDKEIHEKFQNIGQTNRWSFNPPFKKFDARSSLQQQKFQSLTCNNITNDLSLNCVLTYDGKMIETVCHIRRGHIHFEKMAFSLEIVKITKMKVKYEQYQKCLQLTYNEIRTNRLTEFKIKIHILNDIKDDLYLLFSKIMINKLTSLSFKINQHEKDDDKIDRFVMSGSILKKSKFIGKWQLRKMVITDHIQSFKCDKCTFQIKNIKEVWTRFDTLDNCLVVKIRHSFDKTELAIPSANYCARFCKDNWMYRIYKLVSPSLT